MGRTANQKSGAMIGLINMDTKEMMDDGKVIYFPNKVRIKEGWFMAMQDGFERLAKEPVRGETMRVLLYLMSKMDFENWLRTTHGEIAQSLTMKRSNVSRSMRELRERQIVFVDRENRLVLDPSFGWRGGVRNLRDFERAEERHLAAAYAKEDREAGACPEFCV